MTDKYGGEERRQRSGLERHVAIIMQSIVLALMARMTWFVEQGR